MNPKARKEDPKGAAATAQAPANGQSGSSSALAKAVSLHLEGKRKEALQELKGAIAGGNESAEVYSAIGHIQFELEQYEDAAKSYTRLLSMKPEHQAGNFNLAVCLEKLGRYDEASERFNKALELDPNKTEARLGLAICLLHQEKSEAALDNFEKCLSVSPENETALFGKAVSLQLAWRFDEATARSSLSPRAR